MKKIIIGLIQTILTPFIIVLGYHLLSSFNAPEGVMIFACLIGGASIIFNFIIGLAMIVKGHKEEQTFKGW